MKRLWLSCACLLLFGLSGCFVQSFHPFYIKENQVQLPQVVAEWNALDKKGKPIWEKKGHAWEFTEQRKPRRGEVHNLDTPPTRKTGRYILRAYDRDDRDDTIVVTFFKMGNEMFCDFTADGENELKRMPFWPYKSTAIHFVWKVKWSDTEIEFTPLDWKWLTEGVTSKSLSIPFVRGDTPDDMDNFLFTATSEEWSEFLAKYANDKKVFKEQDGFVLKRKGKR